MRGMISWKTGVIFLVVLVLLYFCEFSSRRDAEKIAKKGRIGPFNEYTNCTRVKKIAFLKTHKCASSTVQNILMRFGVKYNLNFVLPSKANYLGR